MIDIWAEIARKYAEPTIAGYDILNEPWVYSSILRDLDGSHVDAFYLKVITAIRRVDRNHILFVEPTNMHSFTFPLKRNIVWSPHFYTLSFAPRYYPSNVTLLEADLAAKYQKFVVEMGSPMWIGEFGAFMRDGSSEEEWVRVAVSVFNKYQIGWAWWAFNDKQGPIPDVLRVAQNAQTTFTSPVVERTVSVTSTVTEMVGVEIASRNETLYLALSVFLAAAFVLALFAMYRRRQRYSVAWQTLSCF